MPPKTQKVKWTIYRLLDERRRPYLESETAGRLDDVLTGLCLAFPGEFTEFRVATITKTVILKPED